MATAGALSPAILDGERVRSTDEGGIEQISRYQKNHRQQPRRYTACGEFGAVNVAILINKKLHRDFGFPHRFFSAGKRRLAKLPPTTESFQGDGNSTVREQTWEYPHKLPFLLSLSSRYTWSDTSCRFLQLHPTAMLPDGRTAR
jgi:hypothetical protein